jgi:HK97 family phage major capsid protein
MRLSDGLKAKRAALFDCLEALSKKADTEQRMFTADEAATWDAATAEIKDLDKQLERQLQAEQLRREQPQRHAIDDKGQRHLILRMADKLADRHPPRDSQPLDVAKMIRGIVTGHWDDASSERRAMGEATLPGGGYSVPQELSALWIDMARAKAVCIAAGAGTLPMATQSLRIAELTQDVVPNFRPEHVPLNENDLVFGAVDLRARLVGVVARASLELISDSPMASDMITRSITAALGLAMDQAMLSGDGVVDATHDNPTGILTNANVNAIAVGAAPADYSHWLDAINRIEVANGTPTAVVDHPNTVNELRKLVTGIAGDKTQLEPPEPYDTLSPFVTTGLAAGNSIVGNFAEGALFGLRETVTIEATRVGDTALKNAEILIRGYMRLDVGITRPKFFTKLTGIARAAQPANARKAA